MNGAEALSHRLFQEAANKQGACAMCGRGRRAGRHPHHVVYAQWLRANGHPIFDIRNALRLCPDCHAAHHDRSKPVPLERLTDDNVSYAFETMGAFAYDYLTRRYDGTDERVERAFKIAEAERLDAIA